MKPWERHSAPSPFVNQEGTGSVGLHPLPCHGFPTVSEGPCWEMKTQYQQGKCSPQPACSHFPRENRRYLWLEQIHNLKSVLPLDLPWSITPWHGSYFWITEDLPSSVSVLGSVHPTCSHPTLCSNWPGAPERQGRKDPGGWVIPSLLPVLLELFISVASLCLNSNNHNCRP